MNDPVWIHSSIITWSQFLLGSYRYWFGRDLVDRNASPASQSEALFEAPFVVVSHGTEVDPILNYGNQAALCLWEMTWEQLRRTPSSQTAEPANREERSRMLMLTEEQGCLEGYRGVRISALGRRFLVVDATVWNVFDEHSQRVGQAAAFSRWLMLS